MGTSLSASAPPAIATSTSPVAIASAAVVSSCGLVAHARATECASIFLGSPAASPTSRAMLGHCTIGITAPNTIWSISLGGSSHRCTSSETAIRPRSRAVRPRKAVPDFTNGVRNPATMAALRPGLVAMASSGGVRRNKRLDAASQARRSVRRSPSGLLLAHLEQVLPGPDARVVAVAPVDAHRVPADRLQVLRPHVRLDLRLADGPLAAPLVDAARAGAARPQPLQIGRA